MRILVSYLAIVCLLGQAIAYYPPPDGCAVALPLHSAAAYSNSAADSFLHYISDLPKASLPCIKYSDVEKAFLSASSLLETNLPAPHKEWTPEDVKEVGELLLKTSKILAKEFFLSPAQVRLLLPRIDISKTSIKNVCPPFASPLKCIPGRYRRMDGLCNNLKHPTWGAINAVFSRLLPPMYADGVSQPKKSTVPGSYLPSPRMVSSYVHRDEGYHDHAASLLLVSWGQLMDHDFTLTATPLDPVNRNEVETCCNLPPQLKSPYCLEIGVPPQDEFYQLFGKKCLDFVRGFPGVRQNCRLGPLEQFNILTSVIDGNTVYGGGDQAALELRNLVDGHMRWHEPHKSLGLKALLPLKTDIPDEGCIRENEHQHCFLAGEIRVNEQLILTCMHTILMREHNRVAKVLASLNPHWSDEVIYQEAKHIVSAEIQHITFSEFLPQLLGLDAMKQFDLILSESYWDGYEHDVNPSMTSSFVAAAFRFGHSLLPSAVERWSPNHKFIASKRLSKLIRQPYDIYLPAVLDEYFLGMVNQPAQAMDDSITQEITNHLFEEGKEHFGFDLVALNLQRGREFGIPGYNAFRKFCGLPVAHSFSDLQFFMTNSTAIKYSRIYKHVDDIDLWSGGVSERPRPGSLLGPTFTCIIGHQMNRLRRGDRFWYELPKQPSSFTPGQLAALKKVHLAGLICDNTDTIASIQRYPLVLHDDDINQRLPCKSSAIPRLDLTLWQDFSGAKPMQQQLPTLIQPVWQKKGFHQHNKFNEL